MIQVTPENISVLYAFEAILSGLLVFVLVWAFLRHRALAKRADLILLSGALASLAVGFLTCSILSFYEFYNQQSLLEVPPEDVGFFFFLVSAVLLGVTFSPRAKTVQLANVLWIGLVVTALLVGIWNGWSRGESHSHWLVLSALFPLLLARGVPERQTGWILRYVWLGLGCSYLFWYLWKWLGTASFPVLLWIGRDLAMLASLVALAHLIEVETKDLFIRFFIRLNLTFIVLAGFIILTVAGLQRRESIAGAERAASDHLEFLRGHILYFHHQGVSDRQLLEQPEITRRIVAAFGAIPELVAVNIRFRSSRLKMTIDPSGLIDREITATDGVEGTDEPVPLADLLDLSTPIGLDAAQVGTVHFQESVETMNRTIAHPILIIFAAFSVMVVFGGVLIGIIVTDADNTIRRQYKELEETHQQLLQAAKLATVGEMAEGVAHEINNPLGVILGRADYLRSLARLRDLEDMNEDLEVIRSNATRAARIIEDLMDFGRPHQLNRQNHDIVGLLEDTIQLVKPRLSDIVVEKSFEQLVPISVDADRVRQVFVNLLNNAIDACGPQGRIWLTARRSEGPGIEVSFIDNGDGIREEHLEKIFDPFFTTKKAGTGLGLSVSYQIIREHGGDILVSSEPEGGTRFVVNLPVTAETNTP